MKKYILAFLCMLLGTPTICEAQKPTIPHEVKENIKKRVENGINAGIVVGVINSEGTTFYSYGVKSMKSKEAVDENSVFQIASLSKTFTGILLADLVVKNELNLDDPLQTLLPKGINAPTRNGHSIKLIHLANHTSSLPNLPRNFNMTNLINPYANYSEKLMYEFLNNHELTRDIGSEYEYSNYGMGLLGHLLATRYEMNYEEYLSDVILKPLGLENTSTVFSPQMKMNLAKGHKIGVEVENWDYLSSFAGAAGIRSTPTEMLNYLGFNMGLKGSDLYSAMELSHENTRREESNPLVGLGWRIRTLDDKEILWHYGESGGYCAFLGFIKGGDKGVVVLTNSYAGVTDIGMHLLDATSPLVHPKPPIGSKLRKIIGSQGFEEAQKHYWKLRESQSDNFNFGEKQLNMLGDLYLWNKEIENALSVFELNIEAFPNSFYAYDRYGEALLQQKDTAKAIAAFQKSIELYPENFSGIKMLKSLGVDTEGLMVPVVLEDEILQSYVGDYELFPGLVLTVSKHGNQLKTKAPGKAEYSIYPKSNNVFYYKALAAQITFNRDDKGEVKSVTLVQEGEEFVGKKLKD
ncbi:serine hydrolase [Xanthovirga aplysinae]|uniref:serine hydrolase n=1 Tax=Xanthovirga aplysinae TaxID=2529853 RepID=UPI0012BC07C8|nr:serine hydrolase [Xanthovirga aplysinae]MTI32522.1 DUF3471 domain-containing protein [Xanthovirga aplysinae]